jgi:hypothetical protein
MDNRDKKIATLGADFNDFKHTVFDYYASIQRLIKIASITLLLGLITGFLL